MKAKSVFLAALLAAALLVPGCAQTTATRARSGFTAGWRGAPLGSLVVEAQSDLPGERAAIEREAAAQLRTRGIKAGASLDELEGRGFDTAIRRRAIMNTGAAGLLSVVPLSREIVERPGGGYGYGYAGFGRSHDHWRHGGGFGFYDPFRDTPVLILREPQARYEVMLYALPHFDPVWSGAFTTRGPTGMEFDELGARFAAQLAERLARDGAI